MAEALQAWRRARETAVLDPLSASASERLSGPLPPTVYSATEDEGWITLNEPLLYVYAGKGPYVSRCVGIFSPAICQLEPKRRDLMAFPVSLPDDGLIDIVAFPLVSLIFAAYLLENSHSSSLRARLLSLLSLAQRRANPTGARTSNMSKHMRIEFDR